MQGFPNLYRNISSTKWPASAKPPPRSTTILFGAALLIGVFVSFRWITSPITDGVRVQIPVPARMHGLSVKPRKLPPKEIPFKCPGKNETIRCSSNAPLNPGTAAEDEHAAPACPEYFRWIHEDLQPWRETGISREMVERAKRTANFRLLIVNGRPYIEKYRKSFQSRDVFTLWGILQLLRRYPGQIPDLDLMFDCVDWPVVKASAYRRRGNGNGTAPPPLFRYCGDDETLDIVFPDWTFWGWPEINIKPWELLQKELKEGNDRIKWKDRKPYAFWKGNPVVAATRQDLLKCNVTETQDWNARVYAQDWHSEIRQGFKQSDLASQCDYRYKIYIEGSAWSVSDKYILACNSVTLIVKPRYYDFYSRGLMPVHHYWPVKDDDKCRSIKFAVDWGNSHKQKAQEIGNAASSFIQEDLKMDYVYDYMFHLLTEYAKLLTYKPTVPPKAFAFCPETMACRAKGLEKQFMMQSLVNFSKDSKPCTMHPSFDRLSLQLALRRKANSINQVEIWERRAWESQSERA
ncbi:hypothetical protein H6P81_017021 [Aristolochia fimbriata]|uniref:Glycosyl transferase CAP10 domain-containing protein n=1 Tax=Aristolochia fimbriata TaxID=158543 RepID=A0AAV7E029_ARIFI|nr:hypothetical protein H6P81_017021 [Aristolochia fimbriata]